MLKASATSLVTDYPPHRLGVWLGRLLAIFYRLTGKVRYDDYRMERVLGLNLLVLPTVANPKLLRTGEFLASQLNQDFISSDSEILDLGTGSGVCALTAARYSRHVTATDINSAATRCAHINALINRLDERIDIRYGDLYVPVASQRFDLILFNPPFLIGEPMDDRDATWRSDNLAERFVHGLADHLKPGGAALVLLSTFGDASVLFEVALRKHEFTLELLARRRYINEVVTLIRASSPGKPSRKS